MSATIVSNTPPFGAMSNQMVSDLFKVNQAMVRVSAAVAAAASGFAGTAGTEYEGNATNFGVLANATPGAKGLDYAFALNGLASNWTTFWAANLASIEALDNGVS